MPVGVHTSIAGGIHLSIDRAVELGCDSMQIFGRNPRSWGFTPVGPEDVVLFRDKRKASGIWPVVIHTTYLINLCSSDDINYEKSVDLFKKEFSAAEDLGADYLVTHLGSPKEMGSEFAFKRITGALSEIVKSGLGKKTGILFENTAGGGSSYGSSLTEIGLLTEKAWSLGVSTGLCFDTCHAFAAGYPMRTAAEIDGLIKAIDKEVGLGRLKLIHLNDSKGGLGSNLDRHEHIGEGKIGLDSFRVFLNRPEINSIPMILETPKKNPEDDPRNLKTVRGLMKKSLIRT